MEIRSMDSFGQSDSLPYLKSSELVEGQSYKRLAFVVNTNSGITKRMDGYYTFYLKSVDNAMLTAQLFNVKDFIMKGFTVKAFIHKPVLVEFTATIFKGRWSLLIEKIELWDKDFEHNLFLDTLNVDNKLLNEVCYETGYNVNIAEWNSSSFPDLIDSTFGAFSVLANAVLSLMKSYKILYGIDLIDLEKTALITLETLFSYYSYKERYPIVRPSTLSTLIGSVTNRTANDDLQEIIVDSCKAAIGMGNPTHLYSILINKSIKTVINDFHLICLNKSMPMGAATKISDDLTLIKF